MIFGRHPNIQKLDQFNELLTANELLPEGLKYQFQLLFPMVTTRDEMLRIRRIVGRARRELDKEGLDFGEV